MLSYGNSDSRTFREAAESYTKLGGSDRYLERIVSIIGDCRVDMITPAAIKDLAMRLHPTCKASTKNRQAITPIRAVMYHAHELGWCPMIRIRGFRTEKSVKHHPVDGEWLSKFINQCDNDGLFHLSALVLFMNHTAARISEAVNLKTEHLNLRKRVALLVKTKTDVFVNAYLTDELMFRITNLAPKPGEPVFKYKSRFSVNERIKAVCARAGILYRPSHSVGRYSFATNAIALGVNIKSAMEAGRWKSSKVFLEIYVNPEDSGRLVSDRINSQRYKYL